MYQTNHQGLLNMVLQHNLDPPLLTIKKQRVTDIHKEVREPEKNFQLTICFSTKFNFFFPFTPPESQ